MTVGSSNASERTIVSAGESRCKDKGFSVPSPALDKLNQNPVKLNVKLDNFDNYSATFLIKFTPHHLHEERAAVTQDFCVAQQMPNASSCLLNLSVLLCNLTDPIFIREIIF